MMPADASNHSGRQSSPPSVLAEAKNTLVSGGLFGTIATNGGTLVQNSDSVVINQQPRQGIHPNFVKEVAPRAFQNAVGQSESAVSRCFPGTRLRVMDDIENWINGKDDSTYQGHFAWLTGPAGCGKSAIMQTLSERCSDQKLPVANFFFHRDDMTRNQIQPLVATLAYQLAIAPGFPGTEDRANQFTTSAVDTDPLIFCQSIEKQFLHLIIALIRHVPLGKPVVLLIDGLDECVSEAQQQNLIRMIHVLVGERNHGLPLKVLFASRPEAHLTMPFNQLGQSAGGLLKLSLDDGRYHPEADILLFVSACFDDIKTTHRLGSNLDRRWPSKDAIDHIVLKSSGQFLYAATVMQFVAKSSTDPADKLVTVITASPLRSLRPLLQQTNDAFARMDVIFTHILSNCAESDWETLRSILAGQIILHGIGDVNYNLYDCLAPLDIDAGVIDPLISRLQSVVQYDADKKRLLFYHASLHDFLLHKARAQKYHIDLNSFAAELVGKIIQKADITKRSSTFKFMSLVLRTVLEPTPSLASALSCCPRITYPLYDDKDLDLHQAFFIILQSIKSLYMHHEDNACNSLLQIWLRWSLPHFSNHLDIISQGMERHGIAQPSEIRAMIRESERHISRTVFSQKARRLFSWIHSHQMTNPTTFPQVDLQWLSDCFWPGDYDRDSAQAAYDVYRWRRDVAELKAAIWKFQHAVDQYRKHNSPSLAKTLTDYAVVVWRHYKDCGRSPADLEKVILLATEAQDSWSGERSSGTYIFLLNGLAGAYFEQYQRAFGLNPIKPDRKQEAFDNAVRSYTESRDNPAAESQRSIIQIQLGLMFLTQCELERTLDGFKFGIQHLQEALSEATNAGKEIDASDEDEEMKQWMKAAVDGIKATCFLYLADSYDVRYTLVNDPRKVHDLTMAIDSNTKAKPLLEDLQRPTLATCLFNLGRELRLQWLQTRDQSDYDMAKEMAEAARDNEDTNESLKQAIDQLLKVLLESESRPGILNSVEMNMGGPSHRKATTSSTLSGFGIMSSPWTIQKLLE